MGSFCVVCEYDDVIHPQQPSRVIYHYHDINHGFAAFEIITLIERQADGFYKKANSSSRQEHAINLMASYIQDVYDNYKFKPADESDFNFYLEQYNNIKPRTGIYRE